MEETWTDVLEEELEFLDKGIVISITDSLHITNVTREYNGEIYRSLYEINGGKLIVHEKLIKGEA